MAPVIVLGLKVSYKNIAVKQKCNYGRAEVKILRNEETKLPANEKAVHEINSVEHLIRFVQGLSARHLLISVHPSQNTSPKSMSSIIIMHSLTVA